MDLYDSLLHNSGIYLKSLISNHGVCNSQWHNADNRRKELIMRKIQVSILLANLEENVATTTKDLKRRAKEELDVIKAKRRKVEPDVMRPPSPKPGCSKDITPDYSSESEDPQHMETEPSLVTTSSSSHSSTMEIEDPPEKDYKFAIATIHPNPEMYSNSFARKWGIARPTIEIHLIDKSLQLFIHISFGENFEEAKKDFIAKTLRCMESTALAFIHTRSGDISWWRHVGGLNGESKVKAFIMQRYVAMQNLGIADSEILENENLINKIFCSKDFNNEASKWINDWMAALDEIIDTDAQPKQEEKLKTIYPKDLFDGLSKVDEDWRNGVISWRGKIVPDCLKTTIDTELDKDYDMVKLFLETVRPQYDEVLDELYEDDKYFFCSVKLMNAIFRKMDEGFDNSFTVWTEKEVERESWLFKALGYSMKEKTYNENFEEGYQPLKEELQGKYYHLWFDELYSMLCKKFKESDRLITYKNLLEASPEDQHPLVTLANKSIGKLWSEMLKTEAAVFSSALSGFYSRLGGAYGQEKSSSKNVRNSIAIFPIYSTLYSQDDDSKEPTRRLSGICLRGPTHAKRPTDRIPIITVEMFPGGGKEHAILSYVSKACILKLPKVNLLIRQNSISKEDPCYLTFNINSLFIPSNLFGVALFQDPQCAQDLDVRDRMSSILRDDTTWFVERFVEGVLMSAIGNTRDEGYFGLLRKIYLIMYSWRKDNSVACYDIETFCNKVNECLIDNPLSMFFHKTVLALVQEYMEIHEKRLARDAE